MRFVKVFHTTEEDFVIGIPDEVEDTDMFLDNVIAGADGWSEAKDTAWEAKQESREDYNLESRLKDGRPVHIVVTDISWDVDEDEVDDVDLPETVVIEHPSSLLIESALDNDYCDAISDYLSDEYGFCVCNFSVSVEEAE